MHITQAHLLGGFAVAFIIVVGIIVRLLVVLPGRESRIVKKKDATLMVLLGSGGHTGEMLRLLQDLDLSKFSQRTWIHYPEDQISLQRGMEFDEQHAHCKGRVVAKQVKRARRVGQGWLSTVFSSISSIIDCFVLVGTNPDVIVCNGPGTSVMLCYAAFLLKFLGLGTSRIIFIESLARVNNLSLSGMLLLPVADRFIVQWPEVASKYKRAEYYNILV